MKRSLARLLVVAGCATVTLAGFASGAEGDTGPAPDFGVTDFTAPVAIGDLVSISVEGCEQGTSTEVDNWHTQATLKGPVGSFNSIISGGVSTASQPNPDGTWTFSLAFEDESLGIQPEPTPGVYEISLRCSRWNGDDPPTVELIDITYEFGWGVVTTTTRPAPTTTVVSTTPSTDGGQGTTAPAPTDPPAVDSGGGDELPVTGSSTVPLALLGGGLIALGVLAGVGRRRIGTS